MTAAEAKKKAQEVLAGQEQNELSILPSILTTIEEYAAKGNLQVVLAKILHPSVINILKGEPYKYSVETKIERHIGGVRTTIISW